MQKVVVILLIIGTFLLAGCESARETLVKVPNRDVVFSITVDKVPEGQPVPHHISAILPDGTIVAQAPLYTGKKNQSKLFHAQDNGTNILVTVKNGNRQTLWLVYTPSSTRFEDPKNLAVMSTASRQSSLKIRDMSIFDSP